MLEHNSKIADFFITIDFGLFWRWPMFVLQRTFGMEEQPASKIIKKHRPYWHTPVRWLAHKTWRKERPCKRQLRYLGRHWCPEADADETFFKIGQIYISKTFNGATYTIGNYDRYIGYAYFERLA
jgi:hypothetical protein